MVFYKSPFADPDAVQQIADTLKRLSTTSIDLFEKTLDKAKRDADDIAKAYGSDFDILLKLAAFVNAFSDNFGKTINTSHDVAKNISSEFDEFVLTLTTVIEGIETEQDSKDAIGEMKDLLKVKNPLQATPLDGFQSVSKVFDQIWALRSDETQHIIEVLETTTDLKETIKELKSELGPVKGGIAKVQQALKDFASHTHN